MTADSEAGDLEGNSKMDSSSHPKSEDSPEDSLPKLNAADFRIFNSMADKMDSFVRVIDSFVFST